MDQNSSKIEVSDTSPIPKIEGLVNTKPYQLKRLVFELLVSKFQLSNYEEMKPLRSFIF